jgi:hypothetical protein
VQHLEEVYGSRVPFREREAEFMVFKKDDIHDMPVSDYTNTVFVSTHRCRDIKAVAFTLQSVPVRGGETADVEGT